MSATSELTVEAERQTDGGLETVTLRLSDPGGKIAEGELVTLPIRAKSDLPSGGTPLREVRIRLVR